MTEPSDHDGEPLSPDQERLADALTRERPVPPAGFRGALGRYLAARDPGYRRRPAQLRLMVAVLVFAGLLLILAGLLQAIG